MSIHCAVVQASVLAVLWGCGVYVLATDAGYVAARWCDLAPTAVVAVATPDGVKWY